MIVTQSILCLDDCLISLYRSQYRIYHDTSIDDHEDANFDQYGEYRHRTIATHTTIPEVEFFDAMEYID